MGQGGRPRRTYAMQRTPWHIRAALLVLAVAWNANVEALPVHHSEHANLGDAAEMAQVPAPIPVRAPIPNAPVTPALQRADANAANAQLKVDQARAAANAVDGPPPQPPQPVQAARFDTDPKAVENAQPTTVATPEMEALDMNPEEVYVKPPAPEFINRNLNPGDDGFVKQQAEEPIHTADHEIHRINLKLQKARDLKYYVARGSKDVLTAAEKGSHATADMANAVREQEEQDVAASEAKIRDIKSDILSHQGSNNKEHAKLQLKLVHEEQKHAKLLSTAKTMGEAVNTAIDKAGDIEGRARAQYHQDMDPQMQLSEAIVDAARAKMALEEHDKQVAEQNRQTREDKKKKDYFKKVQRDGERALVAIEDNADQKRNQQEDKDYMADIKAANDAQQAAVNVGTMRPPQQPPGQDPSIPSGGQGAYPGQMPSQSAGEIKPNLSKQRDQAKAFAQAASDLARSNPTLANAQAAADAIKALRNLPAETAQEQINETVRPVGGQGVFPGSQ